VDKNRLSTKKTLSRRLRKHQKRSNPAENQELKNQHLTKINQNERNNTWMKCSGGKVVS